MNASNDRFNETTLAAMEYRYDSPRARYMARWRNADLSNPGSGLMSTDVIDYDGDRPYGEHHVQANLWTWPDCMQITPTTTVTETRATEPGVAEYDYAAAQGSRTSYYHTNLIGTTGVRTAQSGAPVGRSVYTAFGEPVYVNGQLTRYGYAGAWGYEAPSGNLCTTEAEEVPCDPLAELGWLHVGARYYDPAAGRFMQRDPIGIWGGLNTFGYVSNQPVERLDPDGMEPGNDLGIPEDPSEGWDEVVDLMMYYLEDDAPHGTGPVFDAAKYIVFAACEACNFVSESNMMKDGVPLPVMARTADELSDTSNQRANTHNQTIASGSAWIGTIHLLGRADEQWP